MTFRLPWVSCASVERLERATVRALDFASARAERAERAHDALLEKYHELRVQGANPSPIIPAVSLPVERAEPSAISKVIREQSATADGRTDHALARHLRKYARSLKAEGKTEDEILGKLVEWQSSEPLEHVAEVAN